MLEVENKKTWRNGVYLATATNSLEADIWESKLKSEGIPVIKKYKGPANAMEIIMGSNYSYPIDLYVPEDTLEDAQDIIVAVPLSDEEEEEKVGEEKEKEEEASQE